MTNNGKADSLAILEGAHSDLERLARSSETEVKSVSLAFKSLAQQADAILGQAAAMISGVDKQSMGTVFSNVQSLCGSARDFLERRLEAATGILATLHEEEKLLRQLTIVTQSQEEIARHLRVLSVLTNVEMAHLGGIGGNFQLLAQELSTFSKSLTQQTLELARDTGNRQQTIAETRKDLAASLPRLRTDMTRMGEHIGETIRLIDASLRQQAQIPEQFRHCAQETAQQIAGVVAAIQSHDITRQQLEHVQHSFRLIAGRITSEGAGGDDLAMAHAGLKIQVLQLKNIQTTMANWTSQVRRCMQGIQQLSASDIAALGPTLLRQEQELSSDLARIEQLQQKSQEYSGRMQGTLGALSSLSELVTSHLKRAQTIRDRLQILMFNSLIEAQRLGARGAVVSAIASLIKEVSEQWNAIAKQSSVALSEIVGMVQRTTTLMEVFSEASSQKLEDDQQQTRAALQAVRNAATLVADQATQMQAITQTMHAHLGEVSDSGARLESCFRHLDTALRQTEGLVEVWDKNDPHAVERCDTAEVENWLSAFYTTEIERSVMSVVLHGTAMPVVEQSFAGNVAELF